MWAYLVLTIAAAMVSAEHRDCVACVDERCYMAHPLPVAWGNYRAIDTIMNVLYISKEQDSNLIRACLLDNDDCYVRASIGNTHELSIEPSTGDVYTIGADGVNIYKLNFDNYKLEILVETYAQHLFFKDKLYYSGEDNGIYAFEDGESELIVGTEKYASGEFIVDENYDIYFYDANDGRVRWIHDGVVRLIHTDPSHRYFITVDNGGVAIFYDKMSRVLYRVREGRLDDIGTINDLVVDNILFDRTNNMVYRSGSNSLQIVHLKREEDRTCRLDKYNHIVTSTEADYFDWSPTTSMFAEISTESSDESTVADSYPDYGFTNRTINILEEDIVSGAASKVCPLWISLSVIICYTLMK